MKAKLTSQFDAPIDSIIRSFRTRLVLPHIPKDIALCDIGCGANPTLLKALIHRLTKGVGLDQLITNPVVENNLELRHANLRDMPLPFQNEEFHVITLLAVIEHLTNPMEVISECFRALKKHGKIIITTPTPPSKPILETLARLNIICRESVFDHKHYFTKQELVSLLKKTGFKNIHASYKACGLNLLVVAFKN